MDIRRVILYAALAITVYSLWNAWQMDYPPAPRQETVPVAAVTSDGHLLPHEAVGETRHLPSEVPVKTEKSPSGRRESRLVSVKTDVLNLKIDQKHGDIVFAQLLDYPVSVEEKDKPITLLMDEPDERYVANSALLVSQNESIKTLSIDYSSDKEAYRLAPGQEQLTVSLLGESENGLQVKKEFIFSKGSYLVKVRYTLVNQGEETWKGYMNTQLLRSSPREDKSSIFHIGSYTGASYSNPGQQRYQKVSFSEMAKKNLSVDVLGGWIAMQQHYFLSAWVPDPEQKSKFYTRSMNNDYTIGAVSQPINLHPGDEKQIGSRLYIGPEITSVLKEIAPHLDMTVDYGLLWFLSSLLFSLMKMIYNLVGNWGWSIVLVTVLIKLAFYRLSATSYRSMAGMRKLQPKLQAIRERYGDDKAKISQATMELYRQEKVNPLGGCLPILIQIPVFIALYWVLLESVELRQAPFIFWIRDLASADPYHVLPIVMGATMLVQQKLNPAPPDPMQAKVMMFLPILFTALFWNFPSGLVLYWIVNNTLSILQQWYITRKYSDDKPVKKKLIAANK